MTRTRHDRNPWVLLIPSLLILLTVILGLALPDGSVSGMLLGAGLVFAVILALACIVVGSGDLNAVEDSIELATARQDGMLSEMVKISAKVDAQAADTDELRTRLVNHIALCDASDLPQGYERRQIPSGRTWSA